MKKAKLTLALLLALVLSLGLIAACDPEKGPPAGKDDKIRVPVTALVNGDFEEFDEAKKATNSAAGISDNRIDTLAGWTFENKLAGLNWALGVKAPDTKVRWVCDGNDGFNSLAKVHNNGQALSLGEEGGGADFILKQTVPSLEAGEYELSVWIYTTSSLTQSLSVKQVGGEEKTLKSAKGDEWNKLTFKYTLAEDGDLEVGFNFKDATGGKFAFVDNARLYRVMEKGAQYTKGKITAPTLALDTLTRKVSFNYVPYAEKYIVSYTHNDGAATEKELKIDRAAAKTPAFNSWTLDKDDLGSYKFTVKAYPADGELIDPSDKSNEVTLNIYEVKEITTKIKNFEMFAGEDVNTYLPGKAEVVYDAAGDPTGEEDIVWDIMDFDNSVTDTPQTITGTVQGKFKTGVSNEITATVTKVTNQYVKNGNFNAWALGVPTGWDVAAATGAEYSTDIFAENSGWTPAEDGSSSAKIDFAKGDQTIILSQNIEGLTAGSKYTVNMVLNAGAHETVETIKVTVKLGAQKIAERTLDKDNKADKENWLIAREVTIAAGDLTEGKAKLEITVEKLQNEDAKHNTWFQFDNLYITDYKQSNEAEIKSVSVMGREVTLTGTTAKTGSITLSSAWVSKLATDYATKVNVSMSEYATKEITYASNTVNITVTSEDGTATSTAAITVVSVSDLFDANFFGTTDNGSWQVTLGDGVTALKDASGWGEFLYGGVEPGVGTKLTYTLNLGSMTAGTKLKLDAGINFGGDGSSVKLKVGDTVKTIDPTTDEYKSGLAMYSVEHIITAAEVNAGSITIEIEFLAQGWGAINYANLYVA